MYGPDFTFLGIPRCDLDKPDSYKGADVVIVGAPIDSGTSHRSGAKMGPQAIRMGESVVYEAVKISIVESGDFGDVIKVEKVN